MYCLTPPRVARIGDEYVQRSLTPLLRQITSPVFLFSAASSPCAPPGTQTSCSPSTRGDHEKPQPMPSGPPPTVLIWPPKSFSILLRHRSLPPVSRHTNSPWLPSANTRSPSTVGVALGPRLQRLLLKSYTGPI